MSKKNAAKAIKAKKQTQHLKPPTESRIFQKKPIFVLNESETKAIIKDMKATGASGNLPTFGLDRRNQVSELHYALPNARRCHVRVTKLPTDDNKKFGVFAHTEPDIHKTKHILNVFRRKKPNFAAGKTTLLKRLRLKTKRWDKKVLR